MNPYRGRFDAPLNLKKGHSAPPPMHFDIRAGKGVFGAYTAAAFPGRTVDRWRNPVLSGPPGRGQNRRGGGGDFGVGGPKLSGPGFYGPLNEPGEFIVPRGGGGVFGPWQGPGRIDYDPGPHIHRPCDDTTLSLPERIALGCVSLEAHYTGCRAPTVPPFSTWASQGCFNEPASDYDNTRRETCCYEEPLANVSWNCALPMGQQLDRARESFRVIWELDDLNGMVDTGPILWDLGLVADTLSPFTGIDAETKEKWDNLFATAMYLLLNNVDLIRWISCYYSEMLSEAAGPWDDFANCMIETFDGGRRLLLLPNVAGQNCLGAPGSSAVGEFLSCSDAFIRFVIDPTTGSGNFDAWVSATTDPIDHAAALCTALNFAVTIIHELSHRCRQGHSPSTCSCEFQPLLGRAWVAAVEERYGSCFSHCAVKAGWGDADRCAP